MAPFYQGSYQHLENEFGKVLEVADANTESDTIGILTFRKAFSALEASGEEVITASKIWKGDYYISSEATEDKFKKVADNYRIIHLSTHGVADNRAGDYSYLAFAQVPDSVENELLYVRDLYNMHLNADLVILSACETATGEMKLGEGIISLARAFAYAGAKSMVTSLWVANDVTTKNLMREFHTYLKKGLPKAQALRLAKLRYLDKHAGEVSHPFFWAGFVPIGDMSPIY